MVDKYRVCVEKISSERTYNGYSLDNPVITTEEKIYEQIFLKLETEKLVIFLNGGAEPKID